MDNIFVFGIAGPCNIGFAFGKRSTDGVQAGHPIVVAEDIESGLPHTSHDAHRYGDVGRVGELHADVRDW